jgi:hypothetical protein
MSDPASFHSSDNSISLYIHTESYKSAHVVRRKICVYDSTCISISKNEECTWVQKRKYGCKEWMTLRWLVGTPEWVNSAEAVICDNCRIKLKYPTTELLSATVSFSTLSKMNRVFIESTRNTTPKIKQNDQKFFSTSVECDAFLACIVTNDETQVHRFEPRTAE